MSERRRALELRVRGGSLGDVAEALGCTPEEAQRMISEGFEAMAVETADDQRAVVEARLDGVVRRLESELSAAVESVDRVRILHNIAQIEKQRSLLLGLNLPRGS